MEPGESSNGRTAAFGAADGGSNPSSPLVVPTRATLSRYGLSENEWRAIAVAQNFVCYVCEQPPKKGRLCIDHEHVRGWKKMKPDERKKYVRGLLCWWCNSRYVSRSVTLAKARRVVMYLERYGIPGKVLQKTEARPEMAEL